MQFDILILSTIAAACQFIERLEAYAEEDKKSPLTNESHKTAAENSNSTSNFSTTQLATGSLNLLKLARNDSTSTGKQIVTKKMPKLANLPGSKNVENIDDRRVKITNKPAATENTSVPKIYEIETQAESESKKYSIDSPEEAENWHFMLYFVLMSAIIIFLYVAFHNRRKILGMVVEGRSGNNRRSNMRYSRLKTSVVTDEELR